MNLLYTTSLEPYLGTYRIVWDSESTCEPRTPTAPHPTDLQDGVLTLTRPEHPLEWPKEPSPADGPGSSVVLRLFDTLLGADRTASKLTPSAFSIGPSSLSALSFSPLSDSSSHSSPASSSSAVSSSLSSSKALTTPTRSWRFDWDASFPRLGFRFEGMDVTTTWGHSLAFSDLLDDAGYPFAVLELRPAGFRKDETEPYTILVLAKRQADRYGREGLTEAERERLGMRDVDA
ncbi:hypothetical protein L226DRAFT_532049 [Lentinus tigrinus ALCF2SS1-7]|uniref:Uncharacterized protein n=1 Tax=Lentinus tigrinus ALCF2SS1-6 TaxID=1328759 RepID=A0A5C2S284_9APHY|nr:hypothetical protein L227DRAFT_577840 [Lentinus tigrinus ALCF2SS1-6]RPD78736.1 hypothetical protein L226DRAFT_532049 [Lentinus tigrinus ALCF2SS1-7]